ncbi:MAG: primase [Patescibacteria group bacterium]|nr:primase [Patescibacteria group bacterium]
MTVPLMDPSGQVIGFTGRIITDDPKAPKYLNTPQTLVYDKSRHVFGLSQAKEAIRKADFSVVVEGNLDVVSSHQAGIKNVVASAGTALTEWHLKSLARLSHDVRLSFDADKAGLAATERAIPIASQVGVELTIISLPDGMKDPDELIQHDPALWRAATSSSEPVVDWVLRQYSARVDMKTAAGKRRFTTESLAVIAKLEDHVEKEHYLNKIAQMTETSLEAINAKLNTGDHSLNAPLKAVKQTQSEPAAVERPAAAYQDNLLAVLIAHPETRHHLGNFDTTIFAGPERQSIAAWLKSHSEPLVDEVPAALKPLETYVKIIQLKAESRYEGWSEQDSSLEVAKLLRQTEVEHKKQTKERLINDLRDAESAGNDQLADDLRAQLYALIKETA